MLRNHGMTRSVPYPSAYSNSLVDSRFDFYCLGSNFRGSDINAFIGNLDFAKIESHKEKRIELYYLYHFFLDKEKFILPEFFPNRKHVPFCFPVIFKDSSKRDLGLKKCAELGIETRPIISGNLLRQTCLKQFDEYQFFKNSELLNNNGFYVGLHTKLKERDIDLLVKTLNEI